eukprot:scaffold296457_cov18-Tisochrysis_lutea.AAC.1
MQHEAPACWQQLPLQASPHGRLSKMITTQPPASVYAFRDVQFDGLKLKICVNLEFFKLFDCTDGQKWGGPEDRLASLKGASSNPLNLSSSLKLLKS